MQNAYNTRDSQAVTHPSTNRARRCLTSVIRREPVYSTWYGRRRRGKSKTRSGSTIGKFLGSIVVSILACHARDRGSIPRRGEIFGSFFPSISSFSISSSRSLVTFICRDSIVVSTLRCGRNNPGSNPGHGMPALLHLHNGPSYLFVVVVAQNKAGKADTFHFLKLAHFLDDFFYV